MSRLQLVTVPGYTGSGPGHWQSLWEGDDPSIVRVQQDDWDRPEAESWSASIDRVVRGVAGPVVLVAHSCGTVAVAHWAARFEPRVAGAFLVAPPDSVREDLDEPIRAFALPEFRRLPFPARVVASEDDPYCAFDRARAMARAWGASFVSAGRAGHLHTAAGYGPWPEGRRMLAEFCAALERDDPRG